MHGRFSSSLYLITDHDHEFPELFHRWQILDHQGMDAIADCCVDVELHSRDVSVWIHMG